MLLSYRVEDDYGATRSARDLRRKDEPAKGDGPHPLYGPPDSRWSCRRRAPAVAQTIKDVTDHPWAGDEVVITLTARDERGNEGRSEPFAFHLPERAFTKPLAKALVGRVPRPSKSARARPASTLRAAADLPHRL